MAKRPQTAGEVVSIESLEIPPIGQDPEYAAAVARIEQLHRKKLELEERQARLAGAITASRQSASFHPDQLESQLDQLLSGQTPEGAGSVKDLERELAEVKDSLPPFRGSALQFPRIPFPAGRSGARRSAA